MAMDTEIATDFEVVIGLEVHAQLLRKAKCSAHVARTMHMLHRILMYALSAWACRACYPLLISRQLHTLL